MHRSDLTRRLALALAVAGSLAVARPAEAVSVTLAWNPDPGVTGFFLYYGTDLLPDGGPGYDGTNADQGPSPIQIPTSSLADPNNPEFEISGLTSCSFVYFGLTAYDTNASDGGVIQSTFSNLVGLTVVQRPLQLVATPLADGLSLSWDPLPADDDGSIPTFIVHYGTQEQGDAGQPVDGTGATQGASPISVDASSLANPNAPSYDLTGLTSGTTYFVSVASQCDDGTTEVSTGTSAVAGVVDAGPADAGPADGGAFDAGAFDGGAFDAGAFDAGAFDGGVAGSSSTGGDLGGTSSSSSGSGETTGTATSSGAATAGASTGATSGGASTSTRTSSGATTSGGATSGTSGSTGNRAGSTGTTGAVSSSPSLFTTSSTGGESGAGSPAGGCGCTSASSCPNIVLVALFGLGLGARRRRPIHPGGRRQT